MWNQEPEESPKQSKAVENGQNEESLFSPGFRSVAAMAGWDEEAILVATLVVEDTPDREFKHKKRSDLHFKTPPTNSRRKRRAQKRSSISIPVAVLDLDEGETAREESGKKDIETKTTEEIAGEGIGCPENGKKKIELKTSEEKEIDVKVVVKEEKEIEGDKFKEQSSGDSSSSSSLPCLDKLREELSCAICLEICFEPSTTSCGHSFCKKCLRFAADKCGKRCPKCRQLISNGRSCTVNTVLWNTIQLLFPQEVEARKAAGYLNSREAQHQQSPKEGSQNRGHSSRGSQQHPGGPSRDAAATMVRRRRGMISSSQDEDAALALRLQREEFMGVFRGTTNEQYRSSFSSASARANLRAMASRAISLRIRGRPL